MRGGVWVLNIFAACWVIGGILVSGQSAWLIIIPIMISAIALFWASRQPAPPNGPVVSDHAGRLVGIWSAIEGVAMFVAANVLNNLHLPTAIMPVFAIIVGLHFLPLARGIPVRIYYATGAGLVALGLVALLLPASDRAMVTGSAAALILWASGIVLVRHGRS